MCKILISLMVLGLTLPALAQQTGDANRDYTINANGAGGTSPVHSAVFVPGSFSTLYTTQDPGAPIFLLEADAIILGFTITPTNSIDLDLHTLNILLDGTAPGLLQPLLATNSSGDFSLTGSFSAALTGAFTNLAMAHVAASSPDGWWFSQSHGVSFVGPVFCPSQSTNIGAGDDTATNEVLGFSYTFYGATYTELFIGSNGFLTFGGGDTGFSESVGELLSGFPRIAMWWDDLSPNAAGSVNFFTDNADVATVCFLGVPEFPNTGTNTFTVTLDNTAGDIREDYEFTMTSIDGLVGMSPGGNLDPTGLALDLSQGANTISSGMAAYEQFTGGNPNDLHGRTLSWILDGFGNPVLQNVFFTP